MSPQAQKDASARAYETVRGPAGIGHNSGNSHSLMTVKECCADARFSAATFYRLVKKDPNFPALMKIGGGTRVRSDKWRQYLDSLAARDGEAA